jgi:hypothetical protein
MNRYLIGAVGFGTLVAAAACSSGPVPAVRAAGLERMQCDATVKSQDDLVRSLKVIHVEPLYSHIMTSNNNSEERVNGARMVVRPPNGVSAEQLTRVLQCHGARTLLGQMSGVPNDPYSMPDRWVAIEVRPENGNFTVALSSDTVRDNLELYGRANHYADDHMIATDPGLP